jgi:hypothetical protein
VVRVSLGLARVDDLVEVVATQVLDVDEIDERLALGQRSHERLRHRAQLGSGILHAVHLHVGASGDDRQDIGSDAVGEGVLVGGCYRAQLVALAVVQ